MGAKLFVHAPDGAVLVKCAAQPIMRLVSCCCRVPCWMCHALVVVVCLVGCVDVVRLLLSCALLVVLVLCWLCWLVAGVLAAGVLLAGWCAGWLVSCCWCPAAGVLLLVCCWLLVSCCWCAAAGVLAGCWCPAGWLVCWLAAGVLAGCWCAGFCLVACMSFLGMPCFPCLDYV